MATEFEIDFEGYKLQFGNDKSTAKSGIYCVYRCVFDSENNKVLLKKLIYIGESKNVNERLANHNRFEDWSKSLKTGEVLCYTFGAVPPEHRERCEAAMIFRHKPEFNSEHTEEFNHKPSTIVLTGRTQFLDTRFTVEPTTA
ncbi:GIY-YIG nuclease family protein [Aeromonas sp. 62-46]|uniref:GIY-YIG nuclease family protein n=1 Tax=Aeromonas sp. 62-46 TaxID=1895698 RepID=UPI000AE85965|nr:GIY-YIG nuclease family protein [Aeromonas sp. 62-46]